MPLIRTPSPGKPNTLPLREEELSLGSSEVLRARAPGGRKNQNIEVRSRHRRKPAPRSAASDHKRRVVPEVYYWTLRSVKPFITTRIVPPLVRVGGVAEAVPRADVTICDGCQYRMQEKNCSGAMYFDQSP